MSDFTATTEDCPVGYLGHIFDKDEISRQTKCWKDDQWQILEW